MSNFCCNIDCDNIGNPWGYWGFTWKPCFEEQSEIPGAGGLGEEPYYENAYNSNPVIKYYDYRDDPTLATFDPEKYSWDMNVTKLKSYAMFNANAMDNSRYLRDNNWLVKPFGPYQFRQNHIVNMGLEYNESTSNLFDLGYVAKDQSGWATDPWDPASGFTTSIRGSYLVHRSTEGSRTIAHYVDDTQKYLICIGNTLVYNKSNIRANWDKAFPPSVDPETGEVSLRNASIFQMSEFRNALPQTDESELWASLIKPVISVINIETKEVLYCQPQNYAYDSDLVSGTLYSVVFGEFTNAVSRANWTGNKDYMILSTYDDRLPVNSWSVSRIPILDGLGIGTNGQRMYTPTSDIYNVVRGSFHNYSYSDDASSFAPWVIAYRPSDTKWVTGKWLNAPDPVDEETGESDNRAKLLDEEVENVLTSGFMSQNAKLICYNRIRERELCIWIDNGDIDNMYEWPPGTAPTKPIPFTDPVEYWISQGYIIKGIYMYDSDRPTDKFFTYAEKIVPVWPPGEGITPPDPCNPEDDGKTDDGVPDRLWLDDSGPESRNTRVNIPPGSYIEDYDNVFGLSAEYLDAPTFITCDDEENVYIGSPAWVAKVGRYATIPKIASSGPVQTESYWTYIFRNYYRRVVTSRGTSCDGYESGGLIASTEPTEYLDSNGSAGLNYGRMDSRDFCILPTKKGIFLRGCEATPELATVQWFDNAPYIRPRLYNPGELLGANRPVRSTWLTDWIFSKSGKTRKPCVEEAFLKPKIMTIPSLYTNDKMELPYDIANGSPEACSFILEERGILYYKFFNENTAAYTGGGDPCSGYYDWSMPYLTPENKSGRHTVSRRYGDQLAFNFYVKSTGVYSSQTVAVIEPYYYKPQACLYSNGYTGNIGVGTCDQMITITSSLNNFDQTDTYSLPSSYWGSGQAIISPRFWYNVGWIHYNQYDTTGISTNTDYSLAYEEKWDNAFASGWWGQKYFPYAGLYQGALLDTVDIEETN